MKKEKKVKEEVEQTSYDIRTYFTKEVNKKIAEMTAKEMESSLKAMIDSREWFAILKYIGIRNTFLDSQLRSANPSTDPHSISWAQGAYAGLCDMENYIIELNSKKEDVDIPEENTNSGPEGII